MRRSFLKEVARAGLAGAPPAQAPVEEAELALLPAPARRYLHFMGIVGRPRDWSFRLHMTGRFRLRANDRWRPVNVWQYNSAVEIARIFHMRLRLFGLPVRGRDLYAHGAGELIIRPLDLFTAARYAGPELDVSELVTYLNDAVMMAPSFLLSPQLSWAAVDDDSFDLTLSDRGHTVTARVFVDERGAVRDFSTTDRFYVDNSGGKERPLRTRWSTPVMGWQHIGGRPLPTRGQAIWHLPAGDLPYADFHFDAADIVYNVPPAFSRSAIRLSADGTGAA